ncbi:hypothetical protein [Paenibacillus endoradicis]|uniref:hypothetical protein n=1 Tax=Paenibacillus endoradicis TaxID=2972487 RepID=UPI002159A09F|nr:hypothetical protein [Paenibacillus endoradicis]MCR8656605.1 hypothetical protein [Paenibacillus endoradicis]
MEQVRQARNVAILIIKQNLYYPCVLVRYLAKAQLLDGLKLTTNRHAINELREIIGGSEIMQEARYTDNGKFIMSAGVSAGIDASLHVVGKLFGVERAKQAATIMIVQGHKCSNIIVF